MPCGIPGIPTPAGMIGTPPGPNAAPGIMFGSPAAAAYYPATIILPPACMLLNGTPGGIPPIIPMPGGIPGMVPKATLCCICKSWLSWLVSNPNCAPGFITPGMRPLAYWDPPPFYWLLYPAPPLVPWMPFGCMTPPPAGPPGGGPPGIPGNPPNGFGIYPAPARSIAFYIWAGVIYPF